MTKCSSKLGQGPTEDIRWRRTRRRRNSNKGSRTELAGGKGNNKGFEKKATGLEGIEVGVGATVATVIGEGIVKHGVGKSSEVLGLDQAATSGEIGVKNFSL
jgi:hypothetical protein